MPTTRPTKFLIPSQPVQVGTLTPVKITTIDGMNRPLPIDHDAILMIEQGTGSLTFAATPTAKPATTAQIPLPAKQQQATVYVMASTAGAWTFRVQVKGGGIEAGTGKIIATGAPVKPVTGGTTTNAPVAPAQAVAAGFSTLKFYDDFTDPASVSDGTRDAKWYTASPVEPSKSLKLSDINITNSCLTINTDYSGYSAGLFTYTSASRQSFTPSRGYFEARMSFNQTGHVQGGAWPAFWLYDLNGILTPSASFAELDVLEAYPTSGAGSPNGSASTLITTVHEWSGNTSQVGNYDGNVPKLPAGFSTSQFHTYGVAWTDSAVTWFIDDAQVTTCAVGPGTKFPSMDKARMVVLLGAGKGWPLTVDWVRVWV
jgi:beta-glucanase (GH16 family)